MAYWSGCPGRRGIHRAPVAERARAVLSWAEETYAADRSAPDTRASLLTALSAAVHLGVVPPGEARPRVEEVLTAIEADRTPPTPLLAAALASATAAFSGLQGRISRLPSS